MCGILERGNLDTEMYAGKMIENTGRRGPSESQEDPPLSPQNEFTC
jgi:hypothetical protein